jgi:hypothetical protein
VDPGNLFGVQRAQPLGHAPADIPAECPEPRVAQAPGHQGVPGLGSATPGERTQRQLRVQETGQGWDDHVEGVSGTCSVAGRVGQQRRDAQHFHETAGPAMCQDQRCRRALGAVAAQVNEMHLTAGHLGRVLRGGH